MKRELVKLGESLSSDVPFHSIIREFEIKGEKHRILLGYPHGDARVEVLRGLGSDVDWVKEAWSVVPRGQLQSLTKSIQAEYHSVVQSMTEFIEKECEAEIQGMVTDVICKTGESKDHSEIFIAAINSRFAKLSGHFQSYTRPTTFNKFMIRRHFNVPQPDSLKTSSTAGIWETVSIQITEEGLAFLKDEEPATMENAMMVYLVMPQIAEFALKVYMMLSHLADWEKSQCR